MDASNTEMDILLFHRAHFSYSRMSCTEYARSADSIEESPGHSHISK